MKLKTIFLILIKLNLILSFVSSQQTSGDGMPTITIGTPNKDDSTKDILMQKVFYSIRFDTKKCNTPHCGGYWLKKVNVIDNPTTNVNGGLDQEIYVSEVMSSDPNLNMTMLLELKDINNVNMLIVTGDISPSHSNDGLFNCIHLTDIYRLMKLPTPTNLNTNPKGVIEQYYFIKPSPYLCNGLISDCPYFVTLKVNINQVEFIQSYSEPYSNSILLLDQNWFKSRLVNENSLNSAMVKGYIVGEKLMISSVYLNTMDPIKKCEIPKIRSNTCDKTKPNQLPVFTRTVDRCIVFSECVQRGPCHLGIPSCSDGYVAHSFEVAPKGCLKYYCDPNFLPRTN